MLAALPEGAPPRIGYVVRDTFVAADGEQVDLSAVSYTPLLAVTSGEAGVLVTDNRIFEGTAGLWLVADRRATQLGPDCTSGFGATTADVIAWASFACPETGIPARTVLHLRTPHGERSRILRTPPKQNALTTVRAVVDDDVVYSGGFSDGVFRSDLAGTPRRVPGLTGLSAVDESAGLLAGPVGDLGVVVVDSRDGDRELWRDPRAYPYDFSPDGSRLLVAVGRAWLVVDARTGERVTELARPDGVRLSTAAWEDDEHLLAVAHARGRTAIVRLGLDGTVERVTRPLRERPRRTGYLLDGAS